MIRKTTRDFVLLCIAITYILTGNMLAVFSTGFPFRDYLRLILATWGIITLFRMIDVRRIAIKNILTPLLFLTFLIIPTTVLFYGLKTDFTWTVLQVGDALAWIGVFSIAYRVGLQYPGMIKKAAPVLACSIIIYAALFTQVKLFSAGRGIPLISTAYYTLFFLPFALLSDKKVIKWGGTVLYVAAMYEENGLYCICGRYRRLYSGRIPFCTQRIEEKSICAPGWSACPYSYVFFHYGKHKGHVQRH